MPSLHPHDTNAGHAIASGTKINDKWHLRFFSYLYSYFLANKRSIVLFLCVGTLSAAVNFSSFTLLWKLVGLNYQIALSVAYVLSVTVHFIANRCLTFQSHHIHFLLQMPRYLTMIFINYLITLGITRTVVELLHVTPYLGLLLAIGVTMNTSYLMLRYWVFPRLM
ncbi:MAG: GtrA family protein [Gammaproteobacteria bacterium]|jgi:putative flippase GtrA|nr:GtrA family protein [Gammaproteobacteria bacterium]